MTYLANSNAPNPSKSHRGETIPVSEQRIRVCLPAHFASACLLYPVGNDGDGRIGADDDGVFHG